MLVTLLGITRLLKDSQYSNVQSSIQVMLSGITRLLKDEKEKALSPMLVTLLGITRLFKDSQPLKA